MSLSTSISYPKINNVPCVPEQEVSFKTYNRTDGQTYRGRILGCVNYDIAATCGDVLAIHNDMVASVAKQDIAVQTFIIVKTADGAKRPFATIWIDETTFKAISAATDATLVLHSVTLTDLYNALTTLRDLGYDVTQSS